MRTNSKFYIWIFIIVIWAMSIHFFVAAAYAIDWSQMTETEIIVSDGVADDEFGVTISSDDNCLLVGASGYNNKSGISYIFRYENNNWIKEATLSPSISGEGYLFGNAVAIDGDIAVVGATGETVDTISTGGAVYVFQYNNSSQTWAQTHRLVASDVVSESRFGSSVAVEDMRILVGSLGRNTGGTGSNFWSGRAYVYDYNSDSDSWLETIIYNPEQDADDYFGRSVDLDGDTAIIGADHGVSHPEPSPGQAYIFVKNEDNWDLQQELIPENSLSHDDNYGYSVSIDGNIAIVGALDADNNGMEDSGAAFLFTRSGTTWSQTTVLIGDDTDATDDRFGMSTDIENGTIIISSCANEVNSVADAGSLYIFEENDSLWEQVKQINRATGSDSDSYGISVNISGERVFVGAYMDNSSTGSVFVYSSDATDDTIIDGDDASDVTDDTNIDVDDSSDATDDIDHIIGEILDNEDTGCFISLFR